VRFSGSFQSRIEDSSITTAELQTNPLYFTRTKGLFRVCFPQERPSKVPLYLSPVETYCYNIDYYIPDETDAVSEFSSDEVVKLRKGNFSISAPLRNSNVWF
jgi:hypothetical protein